MEYDFDKKVREYLIEAGYTVYESTTEYWAESWDGEKGENYSESSIDWDEYSKDHGILFWDELQYSNAVNEDGLRIIKFEHEFADGYRTIVSGVDYNEFIHDTQSNELFTELMDLGFTILDNGNPKDKFIKISDKIIESSVDIDYNYWKPIGLANNGKAIYVKIDSDVSEMLDLKNYTIM